MGQRPAKSRLAFWMLCKSFWGDQHGAVPSVEFVLLSVPTLLVVFAAVQTLFLMQATVALENAAYAAARSALVHKCRPVTPLSGDENLFSIAKDIWGSTSCSDPPESSAPWLRAAQAAVVPIAASNGKSQARQGGCGHPRALVSFVVGCLGTGITTQ